MPAAQFLVALKESSRSWCSAAGQGCGMLCAVILKMELQFAYFKCRKKQKLSEPTEVKNLPRL
jgi:hypothetical protein